MAGPRFCYNLWNTSSLKSKDGLTENAPGAPIKSSGTPTPTSAPFQTSTFASIAASALVLPGLYTNANRQRATKLTLELFV